MPNSEDACAPGLELILPRQLARELHMCVRTLQRLNDSRTGPPRIKLGKHIFYKRATVDRWLEQCEGYRPAPTRPQRKPVVSSGRNARRPLRTA
ncbi:MAG: helix-turn-helix domain-containing protein [Terracidiphilus sp.]|jgi:hypothetical protein